MIHLHLDLRKDILVAVVLLVVGAYICLPIPLPGEQLNGLYNEVTHTYWCNNHWACVHERGHKLDQELGFPSQTPQFSDALRLYMLVRIATNPTDKMAVWVLSMPGVLKPEPPIPFYNAMKEIYANIYAYADGDISRIPPDFQSFYQETQP